MNYTWTGLTPVRDSERNVTGFKVNFNGTNDAGDYINGTVTVTMEQFTTTGGDVSKINALIGPAVQTLVGATQA